MARQTEWKETGWIVGTTEAGLRLDKFLAARERLGSRARAAAALDRGKVFINGADASIAHAARVLEAGDTVRLWMDRPGSAKTSPRAGQYGDLQIVYEDTALIVVNKPAGLLSVPLERKPDAPSVYDRIEERFRSHGKRRPFVVHRIDQDTSGLVVFAKDEDTRTRLQEQFKRREPERVYLAVVHGRPEPTSGTWHDHVVWDEKAMIQRPARPHDSLASEAISEYRILESLRDASLLEVRLATGRRNQIRLQASLHGHVLIGEDRYTLGSPPRRIVFHRYALHAFRLVFRHPRDDRRVQYEAPLPADFLDLLQELRR